MGVEKQIRRVSLTVPPERAGQKVDTLLRKALGLSGTVIRRIKWLPDGILLDGERVFTSRRAEPGQVLTVRLSDPERRSGVVPAPGPLDIVYEDGDMLVLNKAPGVLVHPGAGHFDDTIGNFLLDYYDRTGVEADFHPVHRLDKGTSGLIVAAKHPHAQEVLKNQLHTAEFRRIYLAVCLGGPAEEAGTVDAPIGMAEGSIVARAVGPDGLPARTHYRVLERRGDRALVRLDEIFQSIRLIRQCRQENDLCIAVIHGGNEQNPVPSPRQQRTYRAFADFGANAVINFHQHCPQGFEIRNGVPILYSPGNFLFPAGNFENESCRDIPWWYGYMPQLHFDRKGVYSMVLHPYRTEFRPWKIHLLEGEKRKKFFEYLSRLCAILGSEEEMRRFFEAWCAKEWRGAVASLMHGLCPEHSPESQSVRKRLWLRNIHTCESHNEAFSTICRLLEKREADTKEIRAHIEKIIAFQEYFSSRT